ncbi:MAG: MoaD/ThiS family protein [Ktedonobacteraceae bacterium]|nr:MoaD/ThiS family protein [Ktedonobacteraceae bacterium]
MSAEEKVSIALRLPSTLSAYSGGKSQIMLEADTVEQVLALLAQQHPRVWERLCTEDGQLRPHVRIFVNNELVSSASDLQTKLKSGQEVIVLPSTFKP